MQWRRFAARLQWQLLYIDVASKKLKYSPHMLSPYKQQSDFSNFRILVPNCRGQVRKIKDQRVPLPDDIVVLKSLWEAAVASHTGDGDKAKSQCCRCMGWADDDMFSCALCLMTAHRACCKEVRWCKRMETRVFGARTSCRCFWLSLLNARVSAAIVPAGVQDGFLILGS